MAKNHEPVKSARGVYYDLKKSPYEYQSPYGDIFKFSSQKKLDIYTRDVAKEVERLTKTMSRNDFQNYLPTEYVTYMYRLIYHVFYNKVEK